MTTQVKTTVKTKELSEVNFEKGRVYTFKLEYPKNQRNTLVSYFMSLVATKGHCRWIPHVTIHYWDIATITKRQYDHLVLWVKDKFKLDLKAKIVTIDILKVYPQFNGEDMK